MTRSWTIGNATDCDLVVDRPTVSGHHCRLSIEVDGFALEDLGSLNGTYLNGERINGRVRVTQADKITLGQTIPMPWPPDAALPGPRTKVLRIGRELDNDLVVPLPTVSGYHARVVWEGKPGEAMIEDLGSSNGTALGSPDRKITRSILFQTDTVYLGTHPIPAAFVLARLAPATVSTLAFRSDQEVIGRDQACDRVLDHPSVSGRHARLFRFAGRVVIEDLGSASGTYVNGERVDRSSAVQPGDLIIVGRVAFVLVVGSPATPKPVAAPVQGPAPDPTWEDASRVEDAVPLTPAAAPPAIRTVGETSPLEPAPTVPFAPPPWWTELPGEYARIWNRPWHLAVLLALAPLAALAIVMMLRVPLQESMTSESWARASRNVAAILFWLGLAAIWFGLANAVVQDSIDAVRSRDGRRPKGIAWLIARFVVLGALCGFQCVLALAIVSLGAGLKGPWLPGLALLCLASAVGLTLGLFITSLSPRPAPALIGLLVALLPLWLLGGERWPIPRMFGWARTVSSALPSRWVFEGLLLLESDHFPRRLEAGVREVGDSDPAPENDLAEAFFPADSVRMGMKADTIALVAMLVGLAATVAFLSEGSGPGGRGRAG